MEIIQGFPPNIEKIVKKFPLKSYNPIFAYGDKLYNPTGDPISEDLMVHERTHEKQQEMYGVEVWWDKYLEDDTFRLLQETEAYKAQYQYLKSIYSRPARRDALERLASTLASSLYGSLINKKTAKELIENE